MAVWYGGGNSDYGMARTGAGRGRGMGGHRMRWPYNIIRSKCDSQPIQFGQNATFKQNPITHANCGGHAKQIIRLVVAAAVVVALGTELVAGGGVHEGVVEELIFLFVAFIALFLLATLTFGLVLLDFLRFL